MEGGNRGTTQPLSPPIWPRLERGAIGEGERGENEISRKEEEEEEGGNLLSGVISKMTICCFQVVSRIGGFFSFISLLYIGLINKKSSGGGVKGKKNEKKKTGKRPPRT